MSNLRVVGSRDGSVPAPFGLQLSFLTSSPPELLSTCQTGSYPTRSRFCPHELRSLYRASGFSLPGPGDRRGTPPSAERPAAAQAQAPEQPLEPAVPRASRHVPRSGTSPSDPRPSAFTAKLSSFTGSFLSPNWTQQLAAVRLGLTENRMGSPVRRVRLQNRATFGLTHVPA